MIRVQGSYPPVGGRPVNPAPRYSKKAAQKAAFPFSTMFTVYALHSAKFNKIYIGYSSDMENRLDAHNIYQTKGYTFRYRPWVVVYTESYPTKKEAMIRERQLKSAKGREFNWNLINYRQDD
ncbi:GIY-YIG nuclease family protein [uncultured Imperialibacter sp.]|uniref:GIY-YIG nuclease family protein n=1 Tax=uncultured Imperialibacter sp. TaxID=1672639 RepID=UPI0030DB9811